MKKAIHMKIRKHGGKRAGSGRKPTGNAKMRGLRMDDALYKRVSDWARAQDDRPGFSEAVRRLVVAGLDRLGLRGGK